MKKIISFLVMFSFLLPQSGILYALDNVNLEGVKVSADGIYIKTDKEAKYKTYEMNNPYKLIIDLENAKVKTIQDLPVSSNYVKRVKTGQYSTNPDIARVVVELSQKIAYDIIKKTGNIIVLFKNQTKIKDTVAENIPVITPDKPANGTEEYKELKSEIAPKENKPEYSYKMPKSIMESLPKSLISFDYNDADIKEVLNMLANKANINIIYAEDVTGNITISLKNVPFDEAFRTILNVKNLSAQQVGDNILRIATPKTFLNEQKNSMLQTRVFFLSYTKASEIKSQIESIAQAEGRTTIRCNVDDANNALIVTDTPLGLEANARIIKTLDRKPKQVLIEAKLVEVALDSDFNLGIQWSASGNSNGNYIGANNINSSIGPTTQYGNQKSIMPDYDPTKITGTQGNLSASAGGTGVNLPADVIYGAFRLGRVTSNFMFDSIISAAAKKGKAKVLSDPKVATLNNKKAVIEITDQTPYDQQTATVSNGQTTISHNYSNIDTGITLEVTPAITSDGHIAMHVVPSVKQLSAQPNGVAPPPTATRKTDTNVIVNDGETIVIGGLIHDTQSDYTYKVPILGDIPILGYLFKKKTSSRVRMELLIFVTPKVLD
jgi:type IV pilus assembly protein PilQ